MVHVKLPQKNLACYIKYIRWNEKKKRNGNVTRKQLVSIACKAFLLAYVPTPEVPNMVIKSEHKKKGLRIENEKSEKR